MRYLALILTASLFPPLYATDVEVAPEPVENHTAHSEAAIDPDAMPAELLDPSQLDDVAFQEMAKEDTSPQEEWVEGQIIDVAEVDLDPEGMSDTLELQPTEATDKGFWSFIKMLFSPSDLNGGGDGLLADQDNTTDGDEDDGEEEYAVLDEELIVQHKSTS